MNLHEDVCSEGPCVCYYMQSCFGNGGRYARADDETARESRDLVSYFARAGRNACGRVVSDESRDIAGTEIRANFDRFPAISLNTELGVKKCETGTDLHQNAKKLSESIENLILSSSDTLNVEQFCERLKDELRMKLHADRLVRTKLTPKKILYSNKLSYLLHICNIHESVVWNHATQPIESIRDALNGKRIKMKVMLANDKEKSEKRLILADLSVESKVDGSKTNVSLELLKKGHHWVKKQSLDEHGPNYGELETIAEISLRFISVFDGRRFWAYIGTKSDEKLEEMNKRLNKWVLQSNCINLNVTQIKSGQLALGTTEGMSELIEAGISYVRVAIVRVDGNEVTLWCIDYANIITRACKTLRNLSEKLKLIPPFAKLCTFAGLYPSPIESVVRLNATMLTTLMASVPIKFDPMVEERFLDTMMNLCSCPWKSLQKCGFLCIGMAVSTSTYDLLHAERIFSLVTLFLQLVARTIQKPSEDSIDLVLFASTTLRNVIIHSSKLRLHFAESNGLPTMMKFSSLVKDKTEISKLLKVVFGQSDNQIDVTIEKNYVTREVWRQPSRRTNVWRSIAEENIRREIESPVSFETRTETNVDYLIKNETLSVDQSENVLTYQANSFKNIVCPVKLNGVCAILNSGCGGSIYFGLNRDRTIFGIELDRKTRDEVRMTYDSLLKRGLIPELLPTVWKVQFFKVFERNETKDVTNDYGCYVIRIKIEPVSGHIYTNKFGSCYFFENGHVVKVSCQQMRDRVVAKAEKRQLQRSA